MTLLDRARSYLAAMEAGDPSTDAFFAPDVVQREFPTRLVPNGATRGLAALREAGERGKKVVTRQRYEIVNAVEQGDRLALEVIGTATLGVPVGNDTACFPRARTTETRTRPTSSGPVSQRATCASPGDFQ